MTSVQLHPRSVPAWVGLFLAAFLLLPSLARAQRAYDRAPWGTGESRGEDLTVMLITFGPGSPLYEWWGHGAIAIEDARLNQARLYNFGMFDFDKFSEFALGRLEFYVDEAPVEGTLRLYAREDRDVTIQILNLSPAQKLLIGKRLSDNVLPQNRNYLYHHYYDNCATRLRDAIDAAVGGQFKAEEQGPGRFTLREQTLRFDSVSPPMSVLLDFLMNDSIDQPISLWQEAFLPEILGRQVAQASYLDSTGKRVPLVAQTIAYHRSATRRPVPERPPRFWPWLLLIGIALGGAGLGVGHWASTGCWVGRTVFGVYNALFGLVAGLPGTVLFLMWLITDHDVTFHNENLFLANPLTLLLLPLGLMLAFKSRKAPARLQKLWTVLLGLGALLVLLKALPWFDQANWNLIGLFLPALAGTAGGAWLLARGPVRASAPSTSLDASLGGK